MLRQEHGCQPEQQQGKDDGYASHGRLADKAIEAIAKRRQHDEARRHAKRGTDYKRPEANRGGAGSEIDEGKGGQRYNPNCRDR